MKFSIRNMFLEQFYFHYKKVEDFYSLHFLFQVKPKIWQKKKKTFFLSVVNSFRNSTTQTSTQTSTIKI